MLGIALNGNPPFRERALGWPRRQNASRRFRRKQGSGAHAIRLVPSI
jgi:hypothetical protein